MTTIPNYFRLSVTRERLQKRIFRLKSGFESNLQLVGALYVEHCPLLRHGMPLKDRLWKFQKQRSIYFFLIEFSIFSRVNSVAKIFPLHTHTSHITPCRPSLHISLLPSSSPLCVLSNEISTRRSRTNISPHIGRRDDTVDIQSILILASLRVVQRISLPDCSE